MQGDAQRLHRVPRGASQGRRIPPTLRVRLSSPPQTEDRLPTDRAAGAGEVAPQAAGRHKPWGATPTKRTTKLPQVYDRPLLRHRDYPDQSLEVASAEPAARVEVLSPITIRDR